jgi:hypothetical protein
MTEEEVDVQSAQEGPDTPAGGLSFFLDISGKAAQWGRICVDHLPAQVCIMGSANSSRCAHCAQRCFH